MGIRLIVGCTVVGIVIGFVSAKYIAIQTALKPIPYSQVILNVLNLHETTRVTPIENISTATYPMQKICLDIDGNIKIFNEYDLPDTKSIYGRCVTNTEFNELFKLYIDRTKSVYHKILDKEL